MARNITSEQPPGDTPLRLKEWLSRLVININASIGQSSDLDPQGSLPDKPANGMIRYFDFVSGPITQKGFWGYEEGAWVKL